MTDPILDRMLAAVDVSKRAGEIALDFFANRDALAVESKGLQDLVSNADRETEQHVREQLNSLFPDDGVVGEEFEARKGDSEFTWVIDPIDGTANFVRGIPYWCVALACVDRSRAVVGVVRDPVHSETFHARFGGGAFLNDAPMRTSSSNSLSDGIFAVSTFTEGKQWPPYRMSALLSEQHGLCYATGSGALNLAYVACGRFIGFAEDLMMGWDCLAGLLLVEEAGGYASQYELGAMLTHGGSVVASAPGVAGRVRSMLESFPES